MALVELIDLKTRGDARGGLVAIEGARDIPFEIGRVYYIFGAPTDVRRGFHAHRELTQVAIVVRGRCSIFLDNGRETADVTLDDPAKGLLLPPMLWHEMYDFSDDCLLLVLASARYDEADYIRDRDVFLAAARADGS